jgi:hypothetical protein
MRQPSAAAPVVETSLSASRFISLKTLRHRLNLRRVAVLMQDDRY